MSSFIVVVWIILALLHMTYQFIQSPSINLWLDKVKNSTSTSLSVIAGYSDEQALKVIANYFLFFSAILFCISVAIVKLTETDIVILKNLSVALFYFYVSVYLWSKDRKRIVQGILGDLKKLSKRIVFWSIFLAVAFYLYDVLQNEIPITEEDIKTSLMPTIILLLILGSQSFFLHKAFS